MAGPVNECLAPIDPIEQSFYLLTDLAELARIMVEQDLQLAQDEAIRAAAR